MKQKFSFLLALLLSTGLIHSQVTIGSATLPVTGALLELKDGTPDPTSIGLTAKKGLGMPRVELTKLKPTTNDELSASIGATGSWDMTEHIGLIVYNVKDAVWDPATCKTKGAPIGLHVWDGTTWVGIGVKGGSTDLRTVTDDGSKITLSYNGEVTEYRYSSFGVAGTWMTENLATQYLPDGTLLSKHAANSYTDPQYFIPGGNAAITGKEGLLYNWPAAMNRYICKTMNQTHEGAGSTVHGANEVESLEETGSGAKDGKIQGICPTGWHVPSDRELNKLEEVMATQASLYTQIPMNNTSWTNTWETGAGWRGTAHGAAMKSKDTQVNGINPQGDSKPAGSGGFDLPLAGYAYNGSAGNYGYNAYLWSSSSYNGNSAWGRNLYSSDTGTYRYGNFRHLLWSVRCKKD